MKINPLASKSLSRDTTLGIGFVITGAKTYLATGAHFGLNQKTFFGIGIQTGLLIIAFATRYFDKKDPSFGKTIDQISEIATKEIKTKFN